MPTISQNTSLQPQGIQSPKLRMEAKYHAFRRWFARPNHQLKIWRLMPIGNMTPDIFFSHQICSPHSFALNINKSKVHRIGARHICCITMILSTLTSEAMGVGNLKGLLTIDWFPSLRPSKRYFLRDHENSYTWIHHKSFNSLNNIYDMPCKQKRVFSIKPHIGSIRTFGPRKNNPTNRGNFPNPDWFLVGGFNPAQK